MASWTEGNWSQNDSYNDGFPYSSTQYPKNVDFTNVHIPWRFDTEFPIHETLPYIDFIDYDNLHMAFDQTTHNYGFPIPGKIVTYQPDKGAFLGCTNLTSVTIPPTVKFIDYYSFNGTGLTSVTIAPDCYFYSKTFPAGCTINFYTGTIDHIEFPDSSIDTYQFTTGDNPMTILNESHIVFKTTVNGVDYTNEVHRFTFEDFDTSVAATGLTGKVTFTTYNGAQSYSKYITYDVVDPPVTLNSVNENPEETI